jgi:hypothetical protein
MKEEKDMTLTKEEVLRTLKEYKDCSLDSRWATAIDLVERIASGTEVPNPAPPLEIFDEMTEGEVDIPKGYTQHYLKDPNNDWDLLSDDQKREGYGINVEESENKITAHVYKGVPGGGDWQGDHKLITSWQQALIFIFNSVVRVAKEKGYLPSKPLKDVEPVYDYRVDVGMGYFHIIRNFVPDKQEMIDGEPTKKRESIRNLKNCFKTPW